MHKIGIQKVFINQSDSKLYHLNLDHFQWNLIHVITILLSCDLVMHGEPASPHDWHDFVFSECCGFPPVLLILLPPDQCVIHPARGEVMPADRWMLIFSCHIRVKSLLRNLWSGLDQPPFFLSRSFPKWPPGFTLGYVIKSNTQRMPQLPSLSWQLWLSLPISTGVMLPAWQMCLAGLCLSGSKKEEVHFSFSGKCALRL